MTTFNDIFKNGFLESIESFSLGDTLLILFLALVLGLVIVGVYKETYSGVMYSSTFGTSLVGICMITAFVILAVTSNVVLSLGMVGALSIVRFRTAIKEPLDIVFLFWSIAVGIVLGAGLIPLAYIGSALIAIVLFIFANRKGLDSPYIVVINCDNSKTEKKCFDILSNVVKKYKIKSKTVSKDNIELNIEIRLHNNESDFINKIAEINGVNTAILVSYNGEYMC